MLYSDYEKKKIPVHNLCHAVKNNKDNLTFKNCSPITCLQKGTTGIYIKNMEASPGVDSTRKLELGHRRIFSYIDLFSARRVKPLQGLILSPNMLWNQHRNDLSFDFGFASYWLVMCTEEETYPTLLDITGQYSVLIISSGGYTQY